MKEELEITIDPNYAEWGLWEAMRELVQNYLDVYKAGKSTIEYNHQTQHIRLINRGVDMDRSALILGRTDKRDDPESRGQWGEGMKIAWATLLRLGRFVQVTTRREKWVPKIASSETFDGAKVLKVEVYPRSYTYDMVDVEVSKITPSEWQMIRSRVLSFHYSVLGRILIGEGGRVLLDSQFSGKLFAKGIYVCDLPGNWKWGYDLESVELDRDRKVASPMSMGPLICTLLKDLTTRCLITPSTIMEILEDEDCKDGELFADWWNDRSKGSFHAQVAAVFKAKHGDTAVPVSDASDAVDAENHGMCAVIVPKALRSVVESQEGALASRIILQPPATVDSGPRSPLSRAETTALDIAYNAVCPVVPWFARDNLKVVAFKNPNKLGDYRDGKVMVARHLLGSLGMLIVVIAHEVACRNDREGTMAHRNQWSKVLAQAFDDLLPAIGKCEDMQ